MKHIASLVLLLSLNSVASTQTKCGVLLLDKSHIFGEITEPNLEIVTKYGKITVPWNEVQTIKLGLHFPIGIKQEVDAYFKKLGGPIHKEREEAQTNLFKLGKLSFLQVNEFWSKPEGNPEFVRRIEILKKKIDDEIPSSEIRTVDYDLIIAKEATIKGNLVKESIKIKTSYLGNVDIRLSSIDNMELSLFTGVWNLDATRYSLKPANWFNTGAKVSPHNKWAITATGKIDLYPQTPNQYLATPQGMIVHATMFEGNPCGAVIGKIGANGKEFLISNHYISGSSLSQNSDGVLYLRINPSPWDSPISPVGSYVVRIEQTK